MGEPVSAVKTKKRDVTMLNQEDPAHAAAAGRLRDEPIIWLTTVTEAGQRLVRMDARELRGRLSARDPGVPDAGPDLVTFP